MCDPVMLDRAGTALGARKLGCAFIGAERVQSCVDRLRKRLEAAEEPAISAEDDDLRQEKSGG